MGISILEVAFWERRESEGGGCIGEGRGCMGGGAEGGEQKGLTKKGQTKLNAAN